MRPLSLFTFYRMDMNTMVSNPTMTNEQIINYLVSDLQDMIPRRIELDINDAYGDYLEGTIARSQTVLRMMGMPENQIPDDGSC